MTTSLIFVHICVKRFQHFNVSIYFQFCLRRKIKIYKISIQYLLSAFSLTLSLLCTVTEQIIVASEGGTTDSIGWPRASVALQRIQLILRIDFVVRATRRRVILASFQCSVTRSARTSSF